MKNTFLFSLFFLFLFADSFSQINIGGKPYSFENKDFSSDVDLIKMPSLDIDALKEEDKNNDLLKDRPWRFGQNIPVSLDIKESGNTDIVKNGTVWRLGIETKGALTINLLFGTFILPEGAVLYVYNEDKSHVIGGFTKFNNQEDKKFATTLITGDKIIIEYFEPKNPEFEGELVLTRVTHGYRGISDYSKDLGSSGDCNMNVTCPDAIPWEDEVRSVAMIVSGGSGFCTGTLMNNTSQDGTPYFLTADHCYSDPSSWVFWFNWQSENCTDPAVSPSHDDMSGAVLKARNFDSDFCLVELLSVPPSEYEVYYAGWDRSDDQPTSQVGIHHPSGDIKKISFDDDPAVSSDYDPQPNLPNSHWEITQWDRNTTTEPGSSGSALFDRNHRFIGQLHGGYASCTNFTADFYGKFSMSWDRGGSPSTQLKDWLDPTNTGITVLDGYDPYAPTLDAKLLQIIVPETSYISEQNISPTVLVKNRGTEDISSFTVKYKINNGEYVVDNWTGNLETGQFVEIIFPDINILYGNYNFEALVTSVNGGSDMISSNDTLRKDFVVLNTIYSDDFETDNGWTMNGEWERGIPQGLGGEHGNPDPASAVSGTQILGLDLSGLGSYPGDYETDLADRQEFAISPVINCMDYNNISLSFQSWLGVESPSYDHLYIDITTDGGSNWTQVWENTGEYAETNWNERIVDISGYADEETAVQIRFSVGATDGSYQFCGWNIDDLKFVGTKISLISEINVVPGCGANTGSVTVHSSRTGVQTFYLRDDAGDPISEWTGDAVSYEFTGLPDGVYRGQVQKESELSELTDAQTLTNALTGTTAPTIVDASSTDICEGDEITLTFTGGSGADFVWYSSSCGVGLVGIGDNYTVSPAVDITYYGRWENACDVSVCESVSINVTPATKILIQPVDTGADIGEQTTFSVSASGQNLTYQWKFNDVDIDGETNDSYTITSVGNEHFGNYSVTVTGDCGPISSNTVRLYNATSVQTVKDTDFFKIFPNPSYGNVNIRFKETVEDVEIQIFDMSGRKVYYDNTYKVQSYSINLNINKGIYFIQLRTKEYFYISKLIIN